VVLAAPRRSPLTVRVVVVGAGLSGLSAACHLVGRGHDVTVIEQASAPGGLAVQHRDCGYTLDTGPSVLTMPSVLAATFSAAGAALEDYVHLQPVDPAYRACFPNADPLYARAGRSALTAEIRARCGARDAAGFERFCDWLERLYRVEYPGFIDRNYDSPLDLVRPIRPALQLLRLGASGRMAAAVDRYVADPRLRQLLSFQALYAGMSPFEARAVYCVITYMDLLGGVWFPVGGIHAIAAGLAAAAGKRGAAVVYGRRVTRIVQRLGRSGPVRAVRLEDGETVPADAVVATADRAQVYGRLLGGLRARRGRYAPSCILWVAGVRGALPEGAAHHNIHFPTDYRASFDALIDRGTRPPDPATLVSVPTQRRRARPPGWAGGVRPGAGAQSGRAYRLDDRA
jgi:phytoene desaturase